MAGPELSFFRLRVLMAVARTGSITHAAEALFLSQPAVSQHIHEVEQYFGCKLFERSSRGMLLTAQGHAVAETVGRMIGELAELKASLVERDSAANRRVTLAASTTVGNYILSGLLGEFQIEHPDAEFVVHVLTRTQVIDEVQSGTADLGYVVSQRYPRGLAWETMAVVDLIVVAAPDHPLVNKQQVAVAALADERMVMPAPGLPHRVSADAKLRELRISRPHITAEFGSAEAMKKAVEAGLGIALFSQYTVERELAEGRLARLHVHHRALKHNIDLVYRSDKVFVGVLAPFVEFLRRHSAALVRHE
jgi:LysR family transcriptional regulator, transcriptional activator of the cysJI operon